MLNQDITKILTYDKNNKSMESIYSFYENTKLPIISDKNIDDLDFYTLCLWLLIEYTSEDEFKKKIDVIKKCFRTKFSVFINLVLEHVSMLDIPFQKNIINLIINNYQDVDVNVGLYGASTSGNVELVKLFKEAKNHHLGLYLAMSNNNCQLVDYYLNLHEDNEDNEPIKDNELYLWKLINPEMTGRYYTPHNKWFYHVKVKISDFVNFRFRNLQHYSDTVRTGYLLIGVRNTYNIYYFNVKEDWDKLFSIDNHPILNSKIGQPIKKKILDKYKHTKNYERNFCMLKYVSDYKYYIDYHYFNHTFIIQDGEFIFPDIFDFVFNIKIHNASYAYFDFVGHELNKDYCSFKKVDDYFILDNTYQDPIILNIFYGHFIIYTDGDKIESEVGMFNKDLRCLLLGGVVRFTINNLEFIYLSGSVHLCR